MRIKTEEIKEILEKIRKSEERGYQPDLSLGCFQSIGYDIERCKKCRSYVTCELYIESFIEEEPIFRR